MMPKRKVTKRNRNPRSDSKFRSKREEEEGLDMPDKLILTIEVESADRKERKSKVVYDLPGGDTADWALQWFSYYLTAEAHVESTWNDFLNKLPDPSDLCFGSSTTITIPLGPDVSSYYDASNRYWAWLEICNILRGARIYLARARAYKEVETAYSGKPGEQNEVLYTIHLRKMDEFHLAVRNIKKLEDMILRLIFEGMDASLEGINTSEDEWERLLTLAKVKDALKQRDANEKLKSMSDDEYNDLRNLSRRMSHRSNQSLYKFWQYRHALEHRMPQSVDYVELYPRFDRRPEPIVKNGQVIGRCGYIGSRPVNPDWRFDDLYNTTVAVYKHYSELLERLNKLPTFQRPA